MTSIFILDSLTHPCIFNSTGDSNKEVSLFYRIFPGVQRVIYHENLANLKSYRK
jgi:hypothetical protein